MKLATLRIPGNDTSAALIRDKGDAVLLPGRDVGEFISDDDWRDIASKSVETPNRVVPDKDIDFAPLLPRAGKVICCGLNYSDHIQEMGRELPAYPTLFAKYADTLIGARDVVTVHSSSRVDWEAELAVVVGTTLKRADDAQAAAGIAGYTVANDISMRDWQNRTLQWFQGKAFDASTPVGPVLVTADEFPANPTFNVKGYVNGEKVQDGNTGTLVFGAARLLSYISSFTTLRPGDLVLTGTPGGVGMGMTPPRFLADGDVLETEIDGIGRLVNRIDLSGSDSPSSS